MLHVSSVDKVSHCGPPYGPPRDTGWESQTLREFRYAAFGIIIILHYSGLYISKNSGRNLTSVLAF